MNAFDIETFIDKEQSYVPYCVCYNIQKLYYSHYYMESINIIENAIDFIFSLITKDITMYVHNLNFDGMIIISYLSKTKKYKYETFVRNTSFYKIEIYFEKKKINFMCSYKIFPLSLKKIANSFTNLEKMPFPYTYSNLENLCYIGKTPNLQYWNTLEDYNKYNLFNKDFNFKKYSIDYCINDVKITHLFMEKIKDIIKEFDIDITKIYSGPSLALKIFIKKFNKNKISFSHSEFYDKIVRHAYYGGRCEVYGNPYENDYIFHYDFSGMYAQCMKEKIGFGNYIIKTENFDINKPGFYWIAFESNMNMPVLPIHSQTNNKLIFPNGENLMGCYWFEEIELFLKKGGKIKKILYGLEYLNYDNVFNEYVNYFTDIRKRGSAYSTFGKNMINFLYGRLGLNKPDDHTFFIEENELNYYTNWKKYEIKNIIKINNIYMISVILSTSVIKDFNLNNASKFKKNVGVAAAITAKARVKLYNAQEDVINNGGRLLYSDTDSIFAAYKTNVLDEKHGIIHWDKENKDTFIKEAIFVSPKTYGLKFHDNKEKIKIKGFNNTTILYKEMEEGFYNQKSIYQKVNIVTKKNFNLKNEKINKLLNLGEYDKRIFINNFKNTSPIFL